MNSSNATKSCPKINKKLMGPPVMPISNRRWGYLPQPTSKSIKMQLYLVLNGRKKLKYLVLKEPKKLWRLWGRKFPLYPNVIAFYCIFMLKLTQKLFSQRKNANFFLKRRQRRNNFARFAPQKLPPNPKLMGVQKHSIWRCWGLGLPPHRAPNLASLGGHSTNVTFQQGQSDGGGGARTLFSGINFTP